MSLAAWLVRAVRIPAGTAPSVAASLCALGFETVDDVLNDCTPADLDAAPALLPGHKRRLARALLSQPSETTTAADDDDAQADDDESSCDSGGLLDSPDASVASTVSPLPSQSQSQRLLLAAAAPAAADAATPASGGGTALVRIYEGSREVTASLPFGVLAETVMRCLRTGRAEAAWGSVCVELRSAGGAGSRTPQQQQQQQQALGYSHGHSDDLLSAASSSVSLDEFRPLDRSAAAARPPLDRFDAAAAAAAAARPPHGRSAPDVLSASQEQRVLNARYAEQAPRGDPLRWAVGEVAAWLRACEPLRRYADRAYDRPLDGAALCGLGAGEAARALGVSSRLHARVLERELAKLLGGGGRASTATPPVGIGPVLMDARTVLAADERAVATKSPKEAYQHKQLEAKQEARRKKRHRAQTAPSAIDVSGDAIVVEDSDDGGFDSDGYESGGGGGGGAVAPMPPAAGHAGAHDREGGALVAPQARRSSTQAGSAARVARTRSAHAKLQKVPHRGVSGLDATPRMGAVGPRLKPSAGLGNPLGLQLAVGGPGGNGHGHGNGHGNGNGNSGLGGFGSLAIDLEEVNRQAAAEKSYDYSDGGTLTAGGYRINPSGIAEAPIAGPERGVRNNARNADAASAAATASAAASALRRPSASAKRGNGGHGGNGGGAVATPRGHGHGRPRGLPAAAPATAFDRMPITHKSPNGTAGTRTPGGQRTPATHRSTASGTSSKAHTPKRVRENLVLLDEIGRGACGAVHRALYVPSLRLVAVKKVEVHDDGRRRQLVHELNALHALNAVPLPDPPSGLADLFAGTDDAADVALSPSQAATSENIVAFHDAYTSTDRGHVNIVLEYMNAGTLQDFSNSVCAEGMIAAVADSVLKGLVELHARKLIHRDIKPSNILLDAHASVKLSDFGIAKVTEEMSVAHTFTGTLTFMSPERISGDEYSYSSDVWSLGLCVATLALGHVPLPTDKGYWGVVKAVLEDDPPSLSPERDGVHEDLCDFVKQCLQKKAADRATAAELLEHPFLKRCYAPKQAVAPPQGPPSPKSLRAVRDMGRAVTDHMVKRWWREQGTAAAAGATSGAILPKFPESKLRKLAAQMHVAADVVSAVFREELASAERNLQRSRARGSPEKTGADPAPSPRRQGKGSPNPWAPAAVSPPLPPDEARGGEARGGEARGGGSRRMSGPGIPLRGPGEMRRATSNPTVALPSRYVDVALAEGGGRGRGR